VHAHAVQSHEWTDGLVPHHFKELAERGKASPTRELLVFDGPVDSLWIESMNTVLDDNKMLCLTNGLLRSFGARRLVEKAGRA